MRRRLAIALCVSACSATACALVASLPAYEELPPDGGALADREEDAAADGGADVAAFDARPDVAALGCGPPPGSGLIASYRLDEGTGTSVSDCTGASPGTFGGAAPSWVPGRIGPSALAFDGGGFVDISANGALAITGALSVAAWVDVTSPVGGHTSPAPTSQARRCASTSTASKTAS